MRRQTKKYTCFIFISIITASMHTAFADSWQTLAPGIEYRDLSPNPLTPWSHIHAFRISLKENTLDLMTASELSRPHASAEEMARHHDALIAINGGFFDKQYHPLGLRIGHGHRYSTIKPISWWGVFYTINHKPYLTRATQYKSKSRRVDFAIQSGPRLIIKGDIPQLKPGIAERTALGITKHNQVILLVTEHAAMSTTTLANLMKKFPLYCEDALNLDGGSSTQVFANVGPLRLNTPGALGVSDAVMIKAR